jgi:hypothetical protein
LSCLPSLITFLGDAHFIPCRARGGYEQESKQEVLSDPQAQSFEETNPGSQQGKPRFISAMS